MSTCLNCGYESKGGFCPECGTSKAETITKPKFCVNCGTEIAESIKFCANCGTPAGQVPGPSPATPPAEIATISQPDQASPLAADEYIFYKIKEDAVWKNEYDIVSVPEGMVVMSIREDEISGAQKMMRWGQGTAMSNYNIQIKSANDRQVASVKIFGKIMKEMELSGNDGNLLGKSQMGMTYFTKEFFKPTGETWIKVKKHGLTVLNFKHTISQDNSEIAVFDTIDDNEGTEILGDRCDVLKDKDVAFNLKFQFSVSEETKLAAIAVVYQAAHAGGRM